MIPRSLWAAVALSLAAASTDAQVYRSIDGTGNNVANVDNFDWGAAESNFVRLVEPAAYADGMNTPSGDLRPNAREVSVAVSTQTGSTTSHHGLSDWVWQWGQFIDHDITLATTNSAEPLPIMVTDMSDPLFGTIPMNRTTTDPLTGITGPREQVNSQTSFLDASMVYGASDMRASTLREGAGGRLLMDSGLLPTNSFGLANANDAHILDDEDLFVAGDVRANEQVALTAVHTLFAREHNRLAGEIAAANVGWDDEQIYQKARSIVMGEIQAITYNEFLPSLMGGAAPTLADQAYDDTINPGIANEFAGALFRLGHSMVSPQIQAVSNDGTTVASISLENAFFTAPLLIDDAGDVDLFLNGLGTQTQQELDTQIVSALQNQLFGPLGAGGLDLASLNLQRGRDHGLPDYNTLRAEFGLAPAIDFGDITTDTDLAAAMALVYDNDISLVDPWVGALAEDHLAGSSMGALLHEAFDDQFSRLRDGDRFFFLDDPNLTEAERAMISGMALSDIIEMNTSLTNVQDNVFYTQSVPEPSRALLLAVGAVALVVRRKR